MATIRLLQDFKEFLKLLNARKIKYLVIGGYAVGYHGYPRATADMNIGVAAEPRNTKKKDLPRKFAVTFETKRLCR